MWWSLFRLLLAGAGVALTTYVLDRTAERLVRRFAPHRPGSVMPGMLRSCRRPLITVLATSLSLAVQPWVGGSPETREQLHHLLILLAIASGGWLGARVVGLVVEGAVRLAVHRRDPSSAGRARTQAGLLGRICQAIIAIAALGAMLMTFPSVRGIGTSLLASAGLVGVVAGIAAQSVLANLFAGVQLAFGDLVRIGDVVVVSGEWGTVEEITLTAVVIATWDQRRLVMPMSYFAGRPFENWSRRSSRITGTAFLHLDHRAPVPLLRKEFDAFLADSPLWDGEGSALQVVDTTPTTIVVRLLATAANADDAFSLRCQLREHLVTHICEHHPEALPRVSVTPAPRTEPDTPRAPFPPPAQ